MEEALHKTRLRESDGNLWMVEFVGKEDVLQTKQRDLNISSLVGQGKIREPSTARPRHTINGLARAHVHLQPPLSPGNHQTGNF